MILYKMKHLPTGLYYQPIKHGGSNLSKKGKVYQTNSNGIENDKDYIYVYASKKSLILNKTKHILLWEESHACRDQLKAKTLQSEWIREEL